MAVTAVIIHLPEGKTLDNIEWRGVPGFPDYEASEYGHLRRIRKSAKGGAAAGKIKTQYVTRTSPYALSRLYGPNGKTLSLVHRAITLAFYGVPPSPEYHAAHADGNPTNNHFLNLRWATAKENWDDKRKHNTATQGINHFQAVLTEEQVLAMRAEYSGKRGEIIRLARKYGVSKIVARHILRRITWRHI